MKGIKLIEKGVSETKFKPLDFIDYSAIVEAYLYRNDDGTGKHIFEYRSDEDTENAIRYQKKLIEVLCAMDPKHEKHNELLEINNGLLQDLEGELKAREGANEAVEKIKDIFR